MEMNRDQQSLLVYLETCLVDYGGKCESRRMNEDDFKQIALWKDCNLVRFGRLFAREVVDQTRTRLSTHWVLFSEEAWSLAHRWRRERAERLMKKVERNDPSETVAEAAEGE